MHWYVHRVFKLQGCSSKPPKRAHNLTHAHTYTTNTHTQTRTHALSHRYMRMCTFWIHFLTALLCFVLLVWHWLLSVSASLFYRGWANRFCLPNCLTLMEGVPWIEKVELGLRVDQEANVTLSGTQMTFALRLQPTQSACEQGEHG